MVTSPMTSLVKAGFFHLRINSGIGSFFVGRGRGCPVHVGCLEASLGSTHERPGAPPNVLVMTTKIAPDFSKYLWGEGAKSLLVENY